MTIQNRSNAIRAMKILWTLLLMPPIALSQSAPVPNYFFGINHTGSSSAWPLQVTYDNVRIWDTDAQWPSIETAAGVYNYNPIDSILAAAYSQGKHGGGWWTGGPFPSWVPGGGGVKPPTDINADGSGTDATWKTWITAFARHVLNPTYLLTHEKIEYWETFNEAFRSNSMANYTSGFSNNGTFPQLVRMMEDMKCIVQGGTWTGGTISCSSAGIDPTVKMAMPAGDPRLAGTSGIGWIQNLLYCSGPTVRSPCTTGSAGANAVDVIVVHAGSHNQYTPEQYKTQIAKLRAVLETNELGKALVCGECSWGQLLSSGKLYGSTSGGANADAQQAHVSRYLPILLGTGTNKINWYCYDCSSDGVLYNSGLTKGGIAYNYVVSWLKGGFYDTSTALTCKGSACGNSVPGGIWTFQFIEASGTPAEIVWDAGNGSWNVPTPGSCKNPQCGNTAFYAGMYSVDWKDVNGAVHAGGATQIGAKAILLEALRTVQPALQQD